MVDVEFVGQLVDSMSESVLKLEKAIENKKAEEVNRLRTFVFDLHLQISKAMGVNR